MARKFGAAGILRLLALVSVAGLTSCAVFSGKPPLPKQSSIEHLPKPAADTDYSAVVAGADIIYFPSDRAASGSRSEPSAMLLEALRQSGTPFAIAWDLIDAAQQPLLDELQAKPAGSRDELVTRLDLVGNGRAREHCRAVLREAQSMGLLALRCPMPILASVRAGTISAEQQRQISSGFTAPGDGLEAYTERLSSRRVSEEDVAGGYRVIVAAQQFAAAQIVEHFRGAGAGGKLLVFLRDENLAGGQGVPRYVAQKLQLRQVILASDAQLPERRKMLTERGGKPGESITSAAAE